MDDVKKQLDIGFDELDAPQLFELRRHVARHESVCHERDQRTVSAAAADANANACSDDDDDDNNDDVDDDEVDDDNDVGEHKSADDAHDADDDGSDGDDSDFDEEECPEWPDDNIDEDDDNAPPANARKRSHSQRYHSNNSSDDEDMSDASASEGQSCGNVGPDGDEICESDELGENAVKTRSKRQVKRPSWLRKQRRLFVKLTALSDSARFALNNHVV
jgi:hypothetical protein